MADWDELVKIALLGTEQQPLPQLAGEAPVAQLLGKLEASAGKPKEAVLLCAAGTLALHARAGHTAPTSTASRPEPAPKDDVPICGAVGIGHLKLLMESYSQTLLPLWMDAVGKANRRVPEVAVPVLLNFAMNSAKHRKSVARIIGHRGRWLAAQNPEWSWALDAPTDDVAKLKEPFETGDTPARCSALEQLRVSNPTLARELVQSTWKEDGHDVKQKFLEHFRIGLSMEDEPFLEETALEDKRKEVRAAAIQALALLPESRFHRRMVERATQCLRVKGLLKKQLEFDYPKEVDAAMIRDGFAKRQPPLTAEHRMEWLCYMLSVIKPSVWEKQLKLSADQLVNECDAPYEVLAGWAEATALHLEPTWLEAFCTSKRVTQHFGDMMSKAPPAVRERSILKMIERNGGLIYIKGNEYQQPIMVALMLSDHDWSEDFGRKLIPALVEEARDGVNYYGKQVFGVIGMYFPASLQPVMQTAFKEIEPETVEFVDKFLSALKFKAELFGDIK